ncbi:MAG TPA: GNAT family protein [Candidatus Paceibacterota bacterium]
MDTTSGIAKNEKAPGGADGEIVFLRGFKTVLRPLRESDIPLLARWINDPEVRVNLGSQLPKIESDEREFVQMKAGRNVCLMVEVDGVPIGTMGIHDIKYPDATATTGAMIGEKAYWDKGYGSDAKMALLDYAFNTLGLRRLKSAAIAFNERSIAYSKKCGYVVEGVQKEEVYRNGAYHDLVWLAVTRKTWLPIWKKWKIGGRLPKTKVRPS